jgi:probable phosphoglycerate mutase
MMSSPAQGTHEHEKKPPTIVLLVRHAMNEWVKTGKLAGRTPGVHLNQQGREQAKALGERLASTKIHAVYSSPLERARETAEAIARPHHLPVQIVPAIGEVDYGDWTGQELKTLSKKPEWRLVQGRPSAMQFPEGESIRAMLVRAVDEVERLAAVHREERIVLVSHADVIKAIIAHYLGMHLDLFQRLIVSTASISTLSFTPMGAVVVSFNDTAHLPEPPQDG